MDEVAQAKPLTMAFCLDCHRNPAQHLRKPELITDLDWKAESPEKQKAEGTKLMAQWHTESLQNCSACHR
jgi:hypothetical protein